MTTETSTATSGFALVTITADTSTTTSTAVVTSTTTILVAPSAPTGIIGYMKMSPQGNPGASYVLSDGATHMTDNYYYNTKRETFIVTDDGYLYSVTNNAYYYLQGSPSLLFWNNAKSYGQPRFERTRNPDGTLTVAVKNSAGNGYMSFCVKARSTGDGNSGTGLHIFAIPQPGYYSNCIDVQLLIDPAS